MCGRYTIITEKEVLEKRFHAKFSAAFKPRYNAAPSQALPIIIQDDPLHIIFGHWGYPIHFGSQEKEIINVRAEGFEEKKTFHKSLEERRCLVLADGFYEWKKGVNAKTPFRITLRKHEPFAMAGIYQHKEGDKAPHFAIITTTPNSLMAKIHDRMPVVLPEKLESLWLKPKEDLISLFDTLKPYPAQAMGAVAVPLLVNSPKNDRPEVLGKKL